MRRIRRKTIPLRILDVDVVHDLAVVRGDRPLRKHLAISSTSPNKGTTLYALEIRRTWAW